MNKITIVLPIYKVKLEYLSQCLKSIEMQNYNNLECIIIADGVSEKIRKFINNYKSKFKIIYKKNTGVSDSRNIGIENATGDFLMFIDADDWIEQNFCKKMIDCQNVSQSDFVFSNVYINEDIDINNKEKQKKDISKNELIKSVCDAYDKKFSFVESVWAKLYRLDLIRKYDIKFDKDLKIGEDLMFNLLYWERCNKITNIEQCLYHYRINDESVMQSYNTNLVEDYEKLFYKLENNHFFLIKENKEYYNYFIVKQIEKFFRLFYWNKENEKKYFKIKKEIKDNMKNKRYSEALKMVKINQIKKIKTRILIICLKLKCYNILTIFKYIYKIRK